MDATNNNGATNMETSFNPLDVLFGNTTEAAPVEVVTTVTKKAFTVTIGLWTRNEQGVNVWAKVATEVVYFPSDTKAFEIENKIADNESTYRAIFGIKAGKKHKYTYSVSC